jgi:hypothetical protein
MLEQVRPVLYRLLKISPRYDILGQVRSGEDMIRILGQVRAG